MLRLSKIAALLPLASLGLAGTIQPVIPLSVTGTLDACTVDTGDYNSGGFIDVDGWHIKVPKNLIVQFPVIWAPFPKLCGAGAGGYEVSVLGNIVNNQPIAAQVFMSAGLSLRAGQGYIASIDTAAATMSLKNGPVLKLSDPNGVFAKADGSLPFFPVDDENPSVTAFSGYPMCVPRDDPNDALCPASNRPDGSTNFAPANPKAMVPFRVGDFIEYAGLPKNGVIMTYEITAINVQATTTASASVPNYIRVEDAIVGVFDDAPNVEVADLRFIGFLSSCSGAVVKVSAIEVDPCTGDTNLRQIATATPKAGDVRCKWEARIPTASALTPFTKEYMITVDTPVVPVQADIQAGQYVMPVSEWIQPEVNVPGTEPPPFRFKDIRGLVRGDFLDDQKFGQLDPFPGDNGGFTPPVCTTTGTGTPSGPPVADIAALNPDTIRANALVTLVGSNTNAGLQNSALTFAWTSDKAGLTINNAGSPTATFTTPGTAGDIVFTLTVSLKSDPNTKSTKKITVHVSTSANDVVTLDSWSWATRQSGTLTVACHSNVVTGTLPSMNVVAGGQTFPMTSAGGGKFTLSQRNVRTQPANVQCQSSFGGKSVVSSQPLRRRKRGELGM